MSDNPQAQPASEPALAQRRGEKAAGPLIVSRSNQRYFTVASDAEERAVYLTGSHIWNNFHDGMGPGSVCAETPEQFDFAAYLTFLKAHGHNFIRLWRWEQFKSQAAGGMYHLCMTPQPWRRTGPGSARDGQPRFDLDSFDQAYFDRLRNRVMAAGDEGIYAAVMLFEGWGLHLSPPPDNVEGHPFHAANPGEEYLVLQPNDIPEPLTARLEPGMYQVEWFSVNGRETQNAGQVSIQSAGDSSFTAPFSEVGPAVLYLKRGGR